MSRVRAAALVLALVTTGCQPDDIESAQSRPEAKAIVPEHSLAAFGGTLYGTDHGEWGGALMFQDGVGRVRTLLDENVRGIVKTASGEVTVFTGRAHVGKNRGAIYFDSARADRPRIAKLGHLPGQPSRITRGHDGAINFLVYTHYSSRDERPVYQCYALLGDRTVTRSHECAPPNGVD